MSKIAVFFAEGYEEVEALSVVDLCRRAGIETLMVSVTGNKCVTSSHKVAVAMDALLEEVDFDSLDMIVLPGGMPGTLGLKGCEALTDQVKAFAQSGKMIGAICAAPTVFGYLGLLEGKKAGCYPGMEDGLTGAEVSYDAVSVDGNIITSRGMGTAIAFGLAIVEHFCGKETADALGKGIVYYA